MSKIAIILGDFSIGSRPLDFPTLFSSDRGLTGTEIAFIRVAEELSQRHQIELFTVVNQSQTYKGMHVRSTSEIPLIRNEDFDAVINFNEPNLFFHLKREKGTIITKEPFRLVYMMLNDFSFIKPGFDEHTDRYVGVCQEHTDYVAQNSNTIGKWDTVALGCDPDLYTDEMIPGRVIWCSSADRGLHHLLSQWSKIKEAVPYASLRVFYHFNYGNLENLEDNTPNHPHLIEMGQRIRYMKKAMQDLKDFDVEHIGSVSRERMQKEFSNASCFAFPCDTVAFSEGFSCSTLEAHASFTVPVITPTDCLGSIYGNSGATMIPLPVGEHLSDLTEAVIQALTDKQHRQETISKCREFASRHTWKETASQLERIINENIHRQ